MKTYTVPITVSLSGYVTIDAENYKDAISLVRKNFMLPNELTFVEDSLKIDTENPLYECVIRKCKNCGATLIQSIYGSSQEVCDNCKRPFEGDD